MAQPIAFKSRYTEPILKGEKTQTIRMWRNPPSFDVGETVPAKCGWGKEPFAKLLVTRITEKFLHEVSDEEAQADGFDSRDALEEELVALYGEDALYTALYVIGFEATS